MSLGIELACALIVLLLAAAAHAVTSVGFVLLSVPLLALLFDPHTAVVTAVMASGLVALVGWGRERSHVDARSVRWLTLASMPGMPLGLFIFTRVDSGLLLPSVSSPSSAPCSFGLACACPVVGGRAWWPAWSAAPS